MFAERIKARCCGQRFWPAAVLAVLALLALTSVTWAAWVTINTNDNKVDTTWGNPFYTSTCSDGALIDKYEIKNAWVRNNGASIYFRIETCAPPALQGDDNLRASGAIDCNLDGDFTDPYVVGPEGDRIINYNPAVSPDTVAMLDGGRQVTAIYDDTYGERPTSTPVVNLEWKADLKDLPPACRGSAQRIDVIVAVVNAATYAVVDSSTVLQYNMPLDYGDLADPSYLTMLTRDGSRHGLLNSALMLGSSVDADMGNLQGAKANADDTTGATPDDEDGVWPTQGVNWTVGANKGSLDVTVSGGSGYLSCWIDWSNNSSFSDAGDLVISNRAVGTGTAAQIFTIPSGVTFPNTINVRCRVYPTSIASPSSYGAIEFGEVEDHQWAFGAGGVPPAPPAVPVAVTTLAVAPSGANNVLLTWTHVSPNQQYRVLSSPTNPYFAPTDGGVSQVGGLVTASPWEQTHIGVYGPPDVQTYYYIVLGRVDTGGGVFTESGPSNRVGLFEFDLQPGTG